MPLSPEVSQVLPTFTNVPITFRKREKGTEKITDERRLNSTYFVCSSTIESSRYGFKHSSSHRARVFKTGQFNVSKRK